MERESNSERKRKEEKVLGTLDLTYCSIYPTWSLLSMSSLCFWYLKTSFLTLQNQHMKAHYDPHLPRLLFPHGHFCLWLFMSQSFNLSNSTSSSDTSVPWPIPGPLNTLWIFYRSLFLYPIRMTLPFFLKCTLELTGSLGVKMYRCVLPHSQAHKRENLLGRGLGKYF